MSHLISWQCRLFWGNRFKIQGNLYQYFRCPHLCVVFLYSIRLTWNYWVSLWSIYRFKKYKFNRVYVMENNYVDKWFFLTDIKFSKPMCRLLLSKFILWIKETTSPAISAYRKTVNGGCCEVNSEVQWGGFEYCCIMEGMCC